MIIIIDSGLATQKRNYLFVGEGLSVLTSDMTTSVCTEWHKQGDVTTITSFYYHV